MPQLQRLVITPTQRQNQLLCLTHPQQHYLVRVLRMGKGDRFIALDGQGNWWLSELAANLNQATIIESLSVQTELPITVTLMVAMPKGNGFEQVISGATELGVACIIPINSDRTLLNPSPQKLQRWRRLAQEAAEQSERQIVPTILDPINFTASLEQAVTLNTHCYICVARGDAPHLLNCLVKKELLLESVLERKYKPDLNSSTLQNSESLNIDQIDNSQPPSIIIATGPEGGWSATEIEQAKVAGFQRVSLGRRILRAVTAPIVALSIVVSLCDR